MWFVLQIQQKIMSLRIGHLGAKNYVENEKNVFLKVSSVV